MATPEMPEMLTWAPRVPSRKSRFAKTGSPSRERPMGTRRSIASKNRAWSRSQPRRPRHRLSRAAAARRSRARRASPGRGRPATPGAGSTPFSIRNTSESNLAPSWRARTRSTTPKRRTDAAVGQRRLHHHDVVELEELALVDPHPELEGHRVERAEHAADGLAHADASRRSQASMARRMSERVAQQVAQARLEPADRVEVLRGARVVGRVRGKPREERAAASASARTCARASAGRRLQPHDAGEGGVDRTGRAPSRRYHE